MSKDILSVIQTNMSTFSKGQKLIAGFILESYDKAAFMTASRLGKTWCALPPNWGMTVIPLCRRPCRR